MNPRLLHFLRCTRCGGRFGLRDPKPDGEDIVSGELTCRRCGECFPIVQGVPRFVQEPSLSRTRAEIGTTAARFGYEWNYFRDYDCRNFEAFTASLPRDFFTGKVGLDAGCGAGRHAKAAAERGAEVIAVDISSAVDVARHTNRGNARVHVLQADIHDLPLQPESLDFAYSLGVLQHLPDPELGFRLLVPLLKERGAVFVWVYAYAPRKVALELLRTVARRLPNERIRQMAALCNAVDYGVFVNLFRVLSGAPMIGGWIRMASPARIREYARHGFKVSYADWFDRLSAPITHYYKRPEMWQWLARSGLAGTRLQPVDDSWWWLYGEKPGAPKELGRLSFPSAS